MSIDQTVPAEWMVMCDDCGLRAPALERYRGSGLAGSAEIRGLLAALGWTHEQVAGRDRCGDCNRAEEDR